MLLEVGLGCLLEYVRIAASGAGWQAEFELPEDGPRADGPWATAGFAPGPTTQDELQVGRAFVRAWLRLNLAGYGVQVMALPALHALQHAVGVLPADIPADCRRTFATGRAVLTRAFGAPSENYPVWMFRTGLSPSLPDSMRTRRRALEDWVRPANRM